MSEASKDDGKDCRWLRLISRVKQEVDFTDRLMHIEMTRLMAEQGYDTIKLY